MLVGFIVLLITNLLPAALGWILMKNAEFDEPILKKAGKFAIYRSIIVIVVCLSIYFFIPDDKKFIMLIVLGFLLLINITLLRMKK